MFSSMIVVDRLATLCFVPLILLFLTACQYTEQGIVQHRTELTNATQATDVIVGAQRLAMYHPLLERKKVGLVVNQTSTIGTSHLVDTLLSLKLNISKIFAPEHGFRGEADAGEKVEDGKDRKTGLPIISLYGKNKKPSAEQMAGLDVVVFDIQDVGARFYTYISTLHYVMEACAQAGIPIIVLDRPNPNAHYVDGPIMEEEFKSFVGMHPVPVVYGMTIGEYAQMIAGESWLAAGAKVDLTVIPCKNYTHDTFYELPIKPSPNLPNIRSIYLYPSLCFFEGTTVSVGRGTNQQFQIYGHPDFEGGSFSFTPESMAGAKYPKHEGKLCRGYSLAAATMGSLFDRKQLDLEYLVSSYRNLSGQGVAFFNDNNFFEKLAGTASLRQQIIAGMNAEEIRATWASDLEAFGRMRAQYLLYD